ncbi:hypothetical protein ULMS_06500 [Patiriisocius marinistellae]|uniref:Nicotinic acid mononucleotide adenyltransferase n=1 Tax=Patiriisocius marinistellae TaxID=2494560 RepID=A0A5J4FVM1_9FLAO|nr:nicotinic acid mononucleotide adenyltransferase [Patiriisocius marinistellae]GEQ85142.1 hypothetical protein ULMS_06500 [Patiriisocius marinistellae]
MKKLFLLVAVLFATNVMIAQDCSKACDMKKVKNSYVQVGDLIKATLYHENGTVAQTGFYTADNKLEGTWTSYNTKGDITATAEYKKGNKVGVWSFFDGNIKKEVTYSNSKIAKVDTWEIKDTRVVSNKP